MSEGTADRQLRERARAVIPGGMYGHQAAPGAAYPQFMRGGRGARVWDVDGNEYVDLMCSYGPVVLGHQHPKVEAAARAQASTGDCMNSPGAVLVDLAELLVQTVRHADWAIFAKNGTDATTIAFKRRTLDSLPGAFSLGRWAWPVIGFVLAYTVVVMLVLSLPAPFHGSDKVLGYGLVLAALWYFGGLLWRLRKGTAGVKPVEDLAGPPSPDR